MLSGLDNINLLTTIKDRELMLIINSTSFRVAGFRVLDERAHYKLIVREDIDKMPHGITMKRLNNTFFSTSDVDFDQAAAGKCSVGWKAGWWFTDCFDHSVCMTCLVMHGRKDVLKFVTSTMLIK